MTSSVDFDVCGPNNIINSDAYVFYEISNQPQICIQYLPTSPLGQDMTQGQFLSGV